MLYGKSFEDFAQYELNECVASEVFKAQHKVYRNTYWWEIELETIENHY